MNSAPKGRNLAAIIPLSGWQNSFDFPWPDYMHPLREGLLAIDRSVYECAHAGADSIWIVCNDDFAPLVRKRVGDYVMSPRFFEEKDFVKIKGYHEKWIPIYYTPVPQRDRDRRDSLGWSILHGALTAFRVSDKMSKWVLPTKYYVSFPYGIYNPDIVKKYRSAIRGRESFYLSHSGKTVRDNEYLGFTFNPEDWLKFKRNVKSQCSGGSQSLPLHQRWSSKNFSLDRIFEVEQVKLEKVVEIGDYYSLLSWENIKNYYKSDIRIPRPSKMFMKPYIYHREFSTQGT